MEFGMVKMWFFVALSVVLMRKVVHSNVINQELEQLPPNFKPESYVLAISTYLPDKFIFDGKVTIKVTCLESTDTIILHAQDLTIESDAVVLKTDDGSVVPLAGVSYVPHLNLMFVRAAETLSAYDQYSLAIGFSGKLGDKPVGYHRMSHVVDKSTNEERWLAITNFDRINARRAFPCFDVPTMKATFKLHMYHHKDLIAVTNTKRIGTQVVPEDPDYVIDEFEETAPMTTNSVVYMVAEMKYEDVETETIPSSSYFYIPFNSITNFMF